MSPKIKPSGHDIIVLEVGFDLPGQLREGLRSKGFPTHLVASLEEVEVLAPKLPSPIMMISLADDDKVTSNLIEQIAAAVVLSSYPLILLGERVEHLQAEAERYFPLTVAITLPVSSAELLQALQHISRTVQAGRLAASKLSLIHI